MKNLILLAVQGAGKGTLAKALCKKYGYVHISTGDILRQRASVDDELGTQIKNLIDKGILVPDDLILKTIEDKIQESECRNGYILDGFPRNLEQAKKYDEMIKRLNLDEGIVIHLTLPEDLLLKRITGRRICSSCGLIYNIYSDQMNSKQDGICDECGSSLYQRADDNEESMKNRIDTYFKVTVPIIDYYKNKGILYEVDSTDSNNALISVESILGFLGDHID